MAIEVNLDAVMAKRKIGLTALSKKVGVTVANLSVLKNGRGRAVRFSTLDALCRALECTPGELLQYLPDESTDDDLT